MINKKKSSKQKTGSRFANWSAKAKTVASKALNLGKSLLKNPKLFIRKKKKSVNVNETATNSSGEIIEETKIDADDPKN